MDKVERPPTQGWLSFLALTGACTHCKEPRDDKRKIGLYNPKSGVRLHKPWNNKNLESKGYIALCAPCGSAWVENQEAERKKEEGQLDMRLVVVPFDPAKDNTHEWIKRNWFRFYIMGREAFGKKDMTVAEFKEQLNAVLAKREE